MLWDPIQQNEARHERRIAAINAAAVLVFAFYVLSSGAISVSSFALLAGSYIGITLIILGFAAILFAGQVVIRSGITSSWTQSPTRAIADAFSKRWRDERMFCLFWPVALFLLLMPTFNAFKQRILPKAGFELDPLLADLDRRLFGTDPGIWLHQMIGSPAATRFFDAIYHSWFVPTTLGLCVVGLCASPRTRAQYLTAYVGVWIVLGAFLAFLLPAAGPAFYTDVVGLWGADAFLAVEHELSNTTASGGFLTSLYNQQYLMTNFGSPALIMGGGISAIPSVHNAMAVLFAIASFRAHYLVGLAVSAFALLTWIASVYLNWHYAVDGIAGAIGAAILWYGSGLLVNQIFEEQKFAPARPLDLPDLFPAD